MSETRATVWILGDQLLVNHPALRAAEVEHGRAAVQVLMIESRQRSRRLPYHRKKLVLLFSAMRHYAARLEAEGYQVDYRKTDTFGEGLKGHIETYQPTQFYCMAASAYGGRRFQETRLKNVVGVPVSVIPNTQFLTGQYNPTPDPVPGKRYVMEHFYRAMRRHFGLLLEDDGAPTGGQWNFDKENRKPWPKGLVPPEIPHFAPDQITLEVIEELEESGEGFGHLESFDLAVTQEQALEAFEDFLAHRLAKFGPYEDAMSQNHATLFHSVLSPYLNLGLLEPLALAETAEAAYQAGTAPINSVEGFIRQIIGWREYIYWQYWRTMPDLMDENYWEAHQALPEWFWNSQTEMNCLKQVLTRVIDQGYAHHIERLMVLSNFSLLAGLEPQAVNDWFTSGFIDAYEWVMAPNVLGMGLNPDGGLIATKPYIASANYINKMSDYCPPCAYDRKKRTGTEACPFNTLYWNFLIQHEETLRANPRLGRNVLGLRYLDQAERQTVVKQADEFLTTLNV